MNKMLIICGPTATGKTEVARMIASEINGELVSADSRQVYIGMDIGTGKDKEKIKGTKVWMYDVVLPDEPFSVSRYREGAMRAVEDIWSRGKLPVVVGGTGFYIDAILHPQQSFGVKPDEVLRKNLVTYTLKQLQEKLRACDRESFENMNNSDRNNPRRLVRKIEIALAVSSTGEGEKSLMAIQYKIIGLKAPQDILNTRIETRVEARIADGITDEIKSLLAKGYSWDLPSMSGLGYREWKRYFDGNTDMPEVISQWKQDERQYAKRQMTWFKRNPEIEWFDITESGFSEHVTASVLSWYTTNGK